MSSFPALATFPILIFCISQSYAAVEITESPVVGAVPIRKEEGPFDAFISYRRSTSRSLAMLIKVLLEERKVKAFLDVENLEGGFWDDQLKSRLLNSPNFILLLSKGALDRCKGDVNYEDVLHQEIQEAVISSRRIIPIFDEYDFPSTTEFSSEIQTAMRFQGVTWQHALTEASLEKLIEYLTSEYTPPLIKAPAA